MPDLSFENNYTGIIAGVDEAGRGPFAGPVVAAAVILNQKNIIDGINDSKKLSRKKREELYEHIITHHYYGVGIIQPEVIDQINILNATKQACVQAVQNLSIEPNIVLVDGNMVFAQSNFVSIIKGDNFSLSIAAASIIAKVTRDRIMYELHREYPEYLWEKNVGYGTKAHLSAIKSFGLTPYHRKSWRIGEPA